MTKHKLVVKVTADNFEKLMENLELEGWQAIPSTFGNKDGYFVMLMFKVESDSPYRTEATP